MPVLPASMRPTTAHRRAEEARKSYDPRRQQGVSVYREQERLSPRVGGRTVCTHRALARLEAGQREQGTVEASAKMGALSLKMDGGRESSFDSAKNRTSARYVP